MGDAAVGLVLLLGALSKKAIRIALKFCSLWSHGSSTEGWCVAQAAWHALLYQPVCVIAAVRCMALLLQWELRGSLLWCALAGKLRCAERVFCYTGHVSGASCSCWTAICCCGLALKDVFGLLQGTSMQQLQLLGGMLLRRACIEGCIWIAAGRSRVQHMLFCIMYWAIEQ